jgi:hypothetical protein
VASSNSGIPYGCDPKHYDSLERCQRACHRIADAGGGKGWQASRTKSCELLNLFYPLASNIARFCRTLEKLLLCHIAEIIG